MKTINVVNAVIGAVTVINDNEVYITFQKAERITNGHYKGQLKVTTVRLNTKSDDFNLLVKLTNANSLGDLVDKNVMLGEEDGRVKGFDVPTMEYKSQVQEIPAYISRNAKTIYTYRMIHHHSLDFNNQQGH
jgi:hypothetical protein